MLQSLFKLIKLTFDTSTKEINRYNEGTGWASKVKSHFNDTPHEIGQFVIKIKFTNEENLCYFKSSEDDVTSWLSGS